METTQKVRGRYSFRGWTKAEYIDYIFAMGGIMIAVLAIFALTGAAIIKHIPIPSEVYSIPIGMGLFLLAYFFDSIAHRSIYKSGILPEELVIHQYMVFGSAFPLFASFGLAYFWPRLMFPFILTFLFLKSMYSLFDEAMFHWPRYKMGNSDLIEMTAHFIQFGSNILFDIGFLYLIYWNHYECVRAIFR